MAPQLPATPLSKLAIRNKVLATIQQLSSQKSLSTSEQQRCLQRLEDLGDIVTVQDVLIKELERANNREQLDTIGEIITRIGRLQDVQDPLWLIIEHSDGSDILKDTANLILRQLGDRSEPEKYMQFLEDPEQLIHQEMERTLIFSMSASSSGRFYRFYCVSKT